MVKIPLTLEISDDQVRYLWFSINGNNDNRNTTNVAATAPASIGNAVDVSSSSSSLQQPSLSPFKKSSKMNRVKKKNGTATARSPPKPRLESFSVCMDPSVFKALLDEYETYDGSTLSWSQSWPTNLLSWEFDEEEKAPTIDAKEPYQTLATINENPVCIQQQNYLFYHNKPLQHIVFHIKKHCNKIKYECKMIEKSIEIPNSTLFLLHILFDPTDSINVSSISKGLGMFKNNPKLAWYYINIYKKNTNITAFLKILEFRHRTIAELKWMKK